MKKLGENHVFHAFQPAIDGANPALISVRYGTHSSSDVCEFLPFGLAAVALTSKRFIDCTGRSEGRNGEPTKKGVAHGAQRRLDVTRRRTGRQRFPGDAYVWETDSPPGTR